MNNLLYYVLINDACTGTASTLSGAAAIVRDVERELKKTPPALRPTVSVKSLNTASNDWKTIPRRLWGFMV